MVLSLRPLHLPWLRPTLQRFISTSQSCLRKTKGMRNQQRERDREKQVFQQNVMNNQCGPVLLSSGNANIDLESFVRTINRRIDYLRYSNDARRLLKHKGLSFSSDQELEDLVQRFKNATMENLNEQLKAQNYTYAPYRIPAPDELYKAHAFGGLKAIDELVLEFFNGYCVAYGNPLLAQVDNAQAQQSADMRNPGEWYPEARSMRRKIIMHVGPTNSGKTYQALQRLETAKSGWYGGPLRLLAHEVFSKMNDKGITCNLRTGEEIRVLDPQAAITSSTIEMFQEHVEYDVAVIDEIQMIGDQQRGFAWTAALLGLRAKEIHLCGEEAAVPLIRKIVAELGDEFEGHTYKRLSTLALEREALKSLQYIEKGDCVVSFSRTSLFSIKKQIEDQTGLQCAMVYGALPPETRALQAELFNDPNSDFDVIVASDAVGMGLNLYVTK
jgi:ATP-dependent RNA helicase SUPV3L1/SUV3